MHPFVDQIFTAWFSTMLEQDRQSEPHPKLGKAAVELEQLQVDRARVELCIMRQKMEIEKEELGLKKKEHYRSTWRSPLFLAIIGAATAAVGSAVVALINGEAARTLEERKAEAASILEVIKTGRTDEAVENLKFVLETGLVSEKTRARLEEYVNRPRDQQRAVLPPPTSDRSLSSSACASMPVSMYFNPMHRVSVANDPEGGCVFSINASTSERLRCDRFNAKVNAAEAVVVAKQETPAFCNFLVER